MDNTQHYIEATASLFIKNHQHLGEGIIWNDSNEMLYWVDILGDKLHSYNTKTKESSSLSIDKSPAAIMLKENDDLLVFAYNKLYAVDKALTSAKLIWTRTPSMVEKSGVALRYNDGKPSPAGTMWIGTMAMKPDLESNIGKAYLSKIETIKKDPLTLIEGSTISNGLCFDTQKDIFYYIDTISAAIRSYDYNPDSDMITHPKVIINVPTKDGHPDGMTIDSEGMLWVALWGGYKVIRYNPITGEKIGTIHVPDKYVTCPVFGGKDLKTLYITTAHNGENDGGHIYCIDLDIAGTIGHRIS